MPHDSSDNYDWIKHLFLEALNQNLIESYLVSGPSYYFYSIDLSSYFP